MRADRSRTMGGRVFKTRVELVWEAWEEFVKGVGGNFGKVTEYHVRMRTGKGLRELLEEDPRLFRQVLVDIYGEGFWRSVEERLREIIVSRHRAPMFRDPLEMFH